MARRRHRFQSPPPEDPIAAARDSSLALRLNMNFFLRQLGIFVVMDLLLVALACFGLFFYGENRCADVVGLVNVRGIPSADAIPWMEASDYTIVTITGDQDLEDCPAERFDGLLFSREETRDGLRSWDLSEFYTIEMPNNGQPYAITVDTSGIFTSLYWAGVVILICQGLSLVTNLFRSSYTIGKVLRPIQDLASTAARLSSMTHMSRREIESLTGELGKIDAAHLDSRIDLPPTQKELRALAQAINEMMDRVNQAYSAQMRFVSDASHELRTPIAVIQGYAALLDRWGKSDPEALQESISAIRGEAQAMERLVEQLLFLARGDNDSQPVKKEVLDLTVLAGEVLREEEMLHPERSFLPHWGEEPVRVLADPGLVKQLLRILMDNSLKYSPETGKIYLRVLQVQDHVRLTVQDEGMGIPAESIPHIFDRFYRTDQSRDRKTGGTGLGLSIARWIVERHDGWFEVVSRQDVGTRITVVLPAALGERIDNTAAHKL